MLLRKIQKLHQPLADAATKRQAGWARQQLVFDVLRVGVLQHEPGQARDESWPIGLERRQPQLVDQTWELLDSSGGSD